MPRKIFATLAIGLFACSVVGAGARKRSPEFDDYRVPRAPNVVGKIIGMDRGDLNETGAQFRQRIRNAAKAGPNFAGHLAIVGWSCGMICLNLTIVDTRTSRIFHLPFEGIADGPCPKKFYGGPPTLSEFRVNSRLLILRGSTEEWGPDGVQDQPCSTRYYVWRGNRLVLLRKVIAR
jgi:hypothetical protein